MDFRGKKVLVVGMARSGIGAVHLLLEHGALVTANDSKKREQLGDALVSLDNCEINWRLGCPAEECLDGIDMLVISPGIPDTAAFVRKAADMGIPVIGELELAYRFAEGMLIAVTGTNGKTTTVSLLGEILKDAGKTVHVAGNIGTPYSDAAVISKKEDITICEVSSFQLETVEQFHPHIAVFTNLTEDHLDRHGSMEVYGSLKARIFRNQTADDWAVLNADDQAIKKLYRGYKGNVLRFSVHGEVSEGAFVKEDAVYLCIDGDTRKICDTADIRIKGEHNLENALAAVCAAGAVGVPAPVIRHGLKIFSCAEHRIELVGNVGGVDYYDDSKGTNVDATIRAMRSMDKPTIVILGGVDKHCPFEPLAKEMKNKQRGPMK